MILICCPLGDWSATQSQEAAPRLRALASCREHQSLEKEETLFSFFLSIQIPFCHPLLPWFQGSRGSSGTANLGSLLSVQPWWPRSPFLEMSPVKLVFASWFWCQFLWQLAYKRGATPNTIIPTVSDSLVYWVRGWGAGARSDLWTRPSVLLWWANWITWCRYGKDQKNGQLWMSFFFSQQVLREFLPIDINVNVSEEPLEILIRAVCLQPV